VDSGTLENIMGLKYDTISIIEKCASKISHKFKNIKMLELGDQVIHEKHDRRTGKEYFVKKGFNHTSVDLNGLHGSLIKDLSVPSQFTEWNNYFDIITNAGTTEHVEPYKRQWEAFSIIHKCLKPRGIAVHILPEINSRDNNGTWIDHCHYYYSFDFFKKLAKRCDYEIIFHEEFNGNIVVAYIKNQDNDFTISREELLEKISVRNKDDVKKSNIDEIVYNNTMVDKSRISELESSLNSIIEKQIDGDFVECGTWRGGLAALMINKIKNNNLKKHLWVYDTFQGMSEPTSQDGDVASSEFNSKKIDNGTYANWCRATLDIVKNTLSLADENFDEYTTFVVGKVEDTLLEHQNIPNKISLLRLDTDWYESTKIEFEVLYPLVSLNGIIIVDDYSTWQGSNKATEEYLSKLEPSTYSKKISENGSLIIHKLQENI
jgi:hypothetical protein